MKARAMTSPRVEMFRTTKRFGEVVALQEVDFSAARGDIHALLGENGAGKTTLMNILSGLYRADSGEIFLDGRPVSIHAPKDAIELGIGMVHQHVELINNFTALENILLGREGSRWLLKIDTYRQTVADLAERYGLAVPLDVPVKRLPVGVQQKIEILKALHRGVDILILDEPTTMLTPQEVDGFFATLKQLASEGLTVIFITHKINEVLTNCDRITVFLRGQKVGDIGRQEVTQERLVQMMIGERSMPSAGDIPACPVEPCIGPPALSVQGLGVKGAQGVQLLKDIAFEVPRGMVVGLAGVSGNGQRELAEAIAGLRPVSTGAIRLDGHDIAHLSVAKRMALGLGHIPQDRLEEGILPSLPLSENLVLGIHPYMSQRRGRFDAITARHIAREAIVQFNIQAHDERVPAAQLSGGNIQKVLMARAVMLARKIGSTLLIANNPTRGLDVMAAAKVYDHLEALRAYGGGILLISEDLHELCRLCQRILVMHGGELLGSFEGPDYDVYPIGALMAGQRETLSI